MPIEMEFSEEELLKLENKEMEIMKEKLSKIENFSSKIQEISEKLETWKLEKKDNNLIKDTEIVSLNKIIKSENFSMENLFNEK